MPIVLGAVIVFFGILTFRAVRKVGISGRSVTVRVGQTAPLVGALAYKGWFSFSFRLLPGTVTTFTGSSLFTVTPRAITTAAAAPDAIFTITGITPGDGTITVNGTSAEGTHDTETIKVTVTE